MLNITVNDEIFSNFIPFELFRDSISEKNFLIINNNSCSDSIFILVHLSNTDIVSPIVRIEVVKVNSPNLAFSINSIILSEPSSVYTLPLIALGAGVIGGLERRVRRK